MAEKPTIAQLFIYKYYYPAIEDLRAQGYSLLDIQVVALERMNQAERFCYNPSESTIKREVKKERARRPEEVTKTRQSVLGEFTRNCDAVFSSQT